MDHDRTSEPKNYESLIRDRQKDMIAHRWSYLVWSAIFELGVGGFLWFAYAKKGEFFGIIGWRLFVSVGWFLCIVGAFTFFSYVKIILREAKR